MRKEHYAIKKSVGGYLYKVMDNHFPIYVGLVVMMYTLNLQGCMYVKHISVKLKGKKEITFEK